MAAVAFGACGPSNEDTVDAPAASRKSTDSDNGIVGIVLRPTDDLPSIQSAILLRPTQDESVVVDIFATVLHTLRKECAREFNAHPTELVRLSEVPIREGHLFIHTASDTASDLYNCVTEHLTRHRFSALTDKRYSLELELRHAGH